MSTSLADRLIEALPLLDAMAEKMEALFTPLLGPEAPRMPRDLLYGTWFGHPLHPAVVTLPIGFWTSTLVFDLVEEERAADLMLGLGLLSSLPAAASGAAQWQDAVGDDKPRRLGALHAVLNTTAIGLNLGSWLARRNGARGAGIALSTLGLGVGGFSAWLGGDLTYAVGIGVDHAAFEQATTEWTDVLAESELKDATPTRVMAGEAPVMLMRRNAQISAISATCSHLGGPLDEGEIDGDSVTCPWHGSVFCYRDGRVEHGPATLPQRVYEVRVRDGRIELRTQ